LNLNEFRRKFYTVTHFPPIIPLLRPYMIVSRPVVPLISLIIIFILAGCASTTETVLPPPPVIETAIPPVAAGEFDTGKMWTFDFPPIDYFARTYNFNPTEDWFNHARLAALRLPNCTASFVSSHGLVMTNHHCVLGSLDRIAQEGEDLSTNGFYARTLAEERKVEGLHIDQLVSIGDVTYEVIAAFDRGSTDEEKVGMRTQKIREIEQRCMAEENLICSVITFYNGGRYTLYGYKRYNDVRMVYAPESDIGFFGGDPDNFTYPRYNLDVSFLRVYDESGEPYRPEHFFRWSSGGARDGDAVFVIGNPGRTNRLLSFAQLEFNRDKVYPLNLLHIDTIVGLLKNHIAEYPELKSKYETRLFGIENSQKAFRGRVAGLNDPELMGRKVYFEQKFRNAVLADPALRTEFEVLWDEISDIQQEKREIFDEYNALNIRGRLRSVYFTIGSDILEYASQMQLSEDQRDAKYSTESLESTIAALYPSDLDHALERKTLEAQLEYMRPILSESSAAFNRLLGQRTTKETAEYIANYSVVGAPERMYALLENEPSAILESTDPVIAYVAATKDRFGYLRSRYNELLARESARVQQLGRALYDVYGTSIPPDATFTLRIADGIVKSYEYNGTIAPPVTTYFGLYDRYHSFSKQYPWDLPPRWRTPPGEFRLSTPMNFVSTNDAVGGNSGSPVINTNLEVVGLLFDGNIESLSGDFIYAAEKNRSVSVHSEGILEALRYMYDAHRIVRELEQGEIQQGR
jgi:hypothetical protein